ncbi:hypothetical protein BTO32_15065 [Marinobacter lutaoensis]|uniref:Uncharacterized protein n=1 Tax=Marinobacter lutaoensis TaxID=135739 RepID=A0A1V2DPU9_9GAMM|nr:hypothetical protein [Marinobacter lutaoensis]ONF42530.1 hypothetical protein BTO32_15065 [Marinobacter lutaoensis]
MTMIRTVRNPRTDQPRVVLNIIAVVLFIGAAMEFDFPEAKIEPSHELVCPLIQTEIQDESGTYTAARQRCFWAVR